MEESERRNTVDLWAESGDLCSQSDRQEPGKWNTYQKAQARLRERAKAEVSQQSPTNKHCTDIIFISEWPFQ